MRLISFSQCHEESALVLHVKTACKSSCQCAAECQGKTHIIVSSLVKSTGADSKSQSVDRCLTFTKPHSFPHGSLEKLIII